MTGPVVLRPGENCWCLAPATQMAVIIDAADYFKHVKAAILHARRSVLLIGWDIDTRIVLEREGHDTALPNEIGALLKYVVHRNRRLRIRVLRWDKAFLKMPLRSMTPLAILDMLTSRRLTFRLDGHHPAGACHHQKIIVIDDVLAFCGGIDITLNRWDTPAHLDDDQRRAEPGGVIPKSWHDVTTAVAGPAAKALGDLARARWHYATGKHVRPPAALPAIWPAGLTPVFKDIEVAIARTLPAHQLQPEAREIEALYLSAIAAARLTIYLESQYFAGHRIGQAIADRLAEPDGPEIVIINPFAADGWLDEVVMGAARRLLFEKIRAADRFGRLRFYTPVTVGQAHIYVHAKVLVVDDVLLRVGSSNVNNRSMGLDSECDLAVEAVAGRADVAAAILDVRDALLAEHLAVPVAKLRACISAHGSLIGALDVLAASAGKTLLPFEPPEFGDAALEMARTHALDPDRAEDLSETLTRTLQALSRPQRLGLRVIWRRLRGRFFGWFDIG